MTLNLCFKGFHRTMKIKMLFQLLSLGGFQKVVSFTLLGDSLEQPVYSISYKSLFYQPSNSWYQSLVGLALWWWTWTAEESSPHANLEKGKLPRPPR